MSAAASRCTAAGDQREPSQLKAAAPLAERSDRQGAPAPANAGLSLRTRLRAFARRHPALIGTLTLLRAVSDMRRWRDPARVAQWCSGQFADRSDPFGYTEAAELDRFQCALRLLNGLGPFSSALEIGCAEGHFTALLARQCDDLRAADVSEIAIERARARCAGLRVHFIQLDAVEDPLPGSFDLVVIMDVLEMIYDRRVLKRMRDKIVSAVKPGGYLLVGNSRQNPTFETAWWGRWLLRGGKQINDFIGRAPGLTTLRTETSTLAINTLYRRNS